MDLSKHKRLGALAAVAITVAKQHRVSVDAMMAAGCSGQQGEPEAHAAAAALFELHPTARNIAWEALPAAPDYEGHRAKAKAARAAMFAKREADAKAAEAALAKSVALQDAEQGAEVVATAEIPQRPAQKAPPAKKQRSRGSKP